MKLLVWDADNGDRDGAAEIEASTIEQAAEEFACREFDGGDPFEELVVKVVSEDGKVYTVKVGVDYEPEFCAHSVDEDPSTEVEVEA